MTGTFNRVKSTLIEVLGDADHSVIALTGKWGTGKTYLWRKVEAELFGSKKAREKPIYVSMFGAKTINELKLRILQNAYLADASTVQSLMKTGGGVVKELLKKYTGYSAEDAALLWLPNLVAGRLIVIDDVERKHKSLDIDELLGLIDEYSENHRARFLILLNSDKLIDTEDMWATLHEKVIDVEVVLEPSPSESFDVAVHGKACPHLPEFRKAVATLKVNNIRVIERVLRTIRRIAKTSGTDEVPASRWIPSTVLLTTTHYRAVENAPSFEYVMSFNSFSHFLINENEQLNPNELEWAALLEKLGIKAADEYEKTLQEYLQSGLLDTNRLNKLFEHYKMEALNDVVSAQRSEFYIAVWWDPRRSKNDLLDMARGLLSSADALDPGAITDMVSIIEELGDPRLAREFLVKWLNSIELRPEYQQLEERIFDSPHRKLHPEVIAKLDQMRDKQHPPLTLVDTVERIIKNSGWGEREKIALKGSTVRQYQDVLRDIQNETLRRFFKEHLGWIRNGPHDENFKNGADNFVAACVNIYTDAPDSRLSNIIYREFQSNGLEEKLHRPEASASPASS